MIEVHEKQEDTLEEHKLTPWLALGAVCFLFCKGFEGVEEESLLFLPRGIGSAAHNKEEKGSIYK